MDLVHIWLSLVGLVIILYVVLDGFGLGVAILFPTTENESERDLLMDSIGPVPIGIIIGVAGGILTLLLIESWLNTEPYPVMNFSK